MTRQMAATVGAVLRDSPVTWVVGLGDVGSTMARRFAAAGVRVVGIDPDPTARIRALDGGAGVEVRSTADGAPPADVVVEAVPERFATKAAVLRDAVRRCGPDTVLATTTSGLSVTELGAASGLLANVVGLHVGRPAPPDEVMLVELVATPVTSAAVLGTLRALLAAAQCGVVDVGDLPGFIGAGLVLPLLNDAAAMCDRGYARPGDVDAAMVVGCGFPAGPLAELDRLGVTGVVDALSALAARTGDPEHVPAEVLTRFVAAGSGDRGGSGFRRWRGGREDERVASATTPIRRIGVLGSGAAASGLAEVFAAAGYPTVLVAHTPARAVEAVSEIEASLYRRVRRGGLAAHVADAVLARISGTADPAELSDADLAVEAAAEELTAKRAAFSTLDRVTRPGAILASTTSTLSVAACAGVVAAPDHVLGIRFLEPASATTLVEVVRTPDTSDEVVSTVLQLTSTLGRRPVLCRDRTGFIVDALLFPYLNRAAALLEHDLAPAKVDAVMTGAYGHPVGPFRLLDAVGLDVAVAVLRRLGRTPARHLALLADAGWTGARAGCGFYRYQTEQDRCVGSSSL